MKIKADYRWILLLFPGVFTIFHVTNSAFFVIESDFFLSSSYIAITVLLITSSVLYITRNILLSYINVFLVFLLLLFLFYFYTGLLFEFTGSDSSMYFRESQKRLDLSGIDALTNFVKTTKYGWDDTGMIIYSHLIYSIFNNVVFQRLVNFILLIFQGYLIRLILRNLSVSKDVINLTIVLYITNSAILYFVSSGLKETLFTSIVVIIWYWYFLKRRTVLRLIMLIGSTAGLYLFRIPEVVFILVALLTRLSKKNILLLLLVMCCLAYTIYVFDDVLLWYLNRDQQDVAVAKNRGIVYKFSVWCGGIFGPFATFISVEEQRDTLMYSMGLTTLMVIRLYTLFSIKYLVKKGKVILPLLVHVILHIVVLIVVDRTLKIRYWMPAMPAIFLCFAYVLNLSEGKGFVSTRMISAVFTVGVWLTFWNILRYV